MSLRESNDVRRVGSGCCDEPVNTVKSPIERVNVKRPLMTKTLAALSPWVNSFREDIDCSFSDISCDSDPDYLPSESVENTTTDDEDDNGDGGDDVSNSDEDAVKTSYHAKLQGGNFLQVENR